MHTRLLFLQVIYHLLAVLSEVGEHITHMHPVCPLLVVFPNELVEWQMVLDILEYLSPKCHVALDADVGCLPFQVL